ncbi:hypothetical protein GWI72_19250 [Microvirga tunisiensis]|uniref:Uncharacterized protein n=1 Tax=Pannonibacter tanglangensis TaxID=2750084 RepID=A0A7X5F638_9HYPH|nr:hypothetical protein [Pannonibacter sp. XCT-53]NBN80420.1 hypothetical protein [Pannonibacter sp. XCT-53]
MAAIRGTFPTLTFDGNTFSFGHLAPLSVCLSGQGKNGADVRVRISYQSHVFSRRHEGNPEPVTFTDEAGLRRRFCATRYAFSLRLPEVCSAMVLDNHPTWEMRDRNQAANLAVVGPHLVSGPNDLIIYYLFPSRSAHHDVELVVKTAYRKDIDFDRIRRRFKVHQLIKTAYFKGIKIPKT